MTDERKVVVNIYRDGVNGYEVDVEGAEDSHVLVYMNHPDDDPDCLYERAPEEGTE